MKTLDVTDQRFGKLVALRYAERKNSCGKRMWVCVCDCGKEIDVAINSLRSGNTRSCGAVDCCPRTKHGHTARGRATSTWRCWNSMIDRCTNPNNAYYHRYGGRGVRVCDRWLGKHGFENFLADMGERPRGLSIDRFPDPNGGYAPGNCRWATALDQTRNRSATKLTPDLVSSIRARCLGGESQTAVAKAFGVSPGHVSQIINGLKWKP